MRIPGDDNTPLPLSSDDRYVVIDQFTTTNGYLHKVAEQGGTLHGSNHTWGIRIVPSHHNGKVQFMTVQVICGGITGTVKSEQFQKPAKTKEQVKEAPKPKAIDEEEELL